MAQAPAPSPFKFEMHGFAAGTLFMQDGATNGSGQTAIFANAAQPTEDKLMFGADARESRFNFSVTGPQVMRGAIPKAVMEIDWFGNFGAGQFGEVHLLPRLRTAYAELNWGAHRLVFGQNYDLTAAMGPVSLAHIAQPLTLAGGNAGFRRPGVFGYHTFGDLKAKDSNKFEFAWEIGRSAWTDIGNNIARVSNAAAGATANSFTNVGNGIGGGVCAGANGNAVAATTASGAGVTAPPAGAVAGYCTGEASGLPAVQARISWTQGTKYSAYVGGHWNRVDRSGAGVIDPTAGALGLRTLDVIAGVAGAKGVFGPLTVAAAGYIGKNDAPLIASISGGQFTNAGDVHEWGAWGQAGWNFTKELSLWGLAAIERIDPQDAASSGYAIQRNITYSGLLQYRDGGYGLGLEYAHFRTNYVATAVSTQTVNQLALTGIYYF
jgi:hypothetical protein